MKSNLSKNKPEIRYGEAFKLTVVREVEEGGLTFAAVQRRHGIKGDGTVQRWVRQYGTGTRGGIVRVETPAEQGELARLKLRMRRVESALATAQVELALEREYTGLACLRAGITDVVEFKKSGWDAGHRAVAVADRPAAVTVLAVCAQLGMSRQNYYQRRERRQCQAVDTELVLALVRAVRQKLPRVGGRKLAHMLRPSLADAGVKLGRDGLFTVLREAGLLVPRRRAEHPCTTSSTHYRPVYTNPVKDLVVTAPDQVWVADLTYLRTLEGFLYLWLLTDKFSRCIVGYACTTTLDAGDALGALRMAVAQLPPGVFPWHHSDRGSQYCSHEYVGALLAAGLRVSMTAHNHCAENALAERMNGILKDEFELGGTFVTRAAGLKAVPQTIHLYNTYRPHGSLKKAVPMAVHRPQA